MHINYKIGTSYVDIEGMIGEPGQELTCIGLTFCNYCKASTEDGTLCTGTPEWKGIDKGSCFHWDNKEFIEVKPKTQQTQVNKFRDKIRKEVKENGY